MNSSNEAPPKYFYIEFDVVDIERTKKLEVFFNKLKEEKDKFLLTEIEPSCEIEDWIDYLDADAKEWFNKIELKPNSEQLKIYNKLWRLTKPEIRIKHPMFNTADNWSLDSMVDAIFQGNYELVKIESDESKGTLYYNPDGMPFGGTESLVQLIESFGNRVTFDYWHQGPHKRQEIGWDFELAKSLVEQEKGIEISADKPWWQFWK